MTSYNQKEVMRYVAGFSLFIVFSQNSLAQSSDKIGDIYSNGVHVAREKGTNPVIYNNDWVMDSPEDQYVRLKPTILRSSAIRTDIIDAVRIVR
jgi:hypothetical protein